MSEKKHILIIGGTRGIGRVTTGLLAEDKNYQPVILSRNAADPADQLPGGKYFTCDISNDAERAAFIEQLQTDGIALDGLVFFQRHRGSENAWAGNLEATLTATQKMIETCRPLLRAEGDKSIVMLGSIAARHVADEQDAGYHAAKAGLNGLMRYYAVTLGAQGVRVNCVSPGTLLKPESQHYFLENEALHKMYRSVTPLDRMGTAEEVARVIRFLLSKESSFITGQDIIVDGGAGLLWQESLGRKLIQS